MDGCSSNVDVWTHSCVLHYFLLIKAQGFGDVGMVIIVIFLSF